MVLGHHPIAFPKRADAQIAALGKFATLKSFHIGEKLFAEGERDFKFFSVKNGEVEIVDHSSMLTGARGSRAPVSMQIAESWPRRRQPFLLETSLPGICATGDVRSGSTKRVASAAGEGAMAVQFVHELPASS